MSQPSFQSGAAANSQRYGSQPQSQALSKQRSTNAQQVAQSPTAALRPIERAAKAINDTLGADMKYPELDSYLGRKFLERLVEELRL